MDISVSTVLTLNQSSICKLQFVLIALKDQNSILQKDHAKLYKKLFLLQLLQILQHLIVFLVKCHH